MPLYEQHGAGGFFTIRPTGSRVDFDCGAGERLSGWIASVEGFARPGKALVFLGGLLVHARVSTTAREFSGKLGELEFEVDHGVEDVRPFSDVLFFKECLFFFYRGVEGICNAVDQVC